jgi:hypothetical protein
MIQFVSVPKRGDAVLGRKADGKVLFVNHEALNTAIDTIDTDVYEKIGFVIRRTGKDVLIAYYQNSSKKWSDRYSFKLTGYTLDGTARTGTLSIREASNSWASGVDYVVSYNASTVDDFITQLNAFFQDTANPVFQTQDWVAIKESDNSVTLHFAFTNNKQASNTAKSGFALTANFLPEITELANIRRKHGGTGGEGVISSYWRALAYFRSDNDSTNYNPASDVTSIKTSRPVCLPAYLGTSQYQSDHCALLRQTYGEGEAGWLRYMQSCMPVNPTDYGNMGITNGLELTRILAGKTYTSPAKPNPTILCPAASYCYGISTIAIPQGKWYLPTVRDVSDMLIDVKYNTPNTATKDDTINRTLSWLGGNAISNGSYFWSSCRYGAGSAWLALGNYGFFGNGYMYTSLVAVPFSLYKLA